MASCGVREGPGRNGGRLADLAGSFLGGKITYPGQEQHTNQVIDYLGKTTRIKYSRVDLAQVCSYIALVPGHNDLFEKLAKRGLKLFPDAYEFPMMLGSVEIQKGPHQADFTKTRKYFESALKLAQAQESVDPKIADLIPKIKQALSTVNDLSGGLMGLPFPTDSRGGPPESFFDMFQSMMDEHGIDPDDLFGPEDDEDDGWDPTPIPTPTPRPRRKAKKR